MVTSIFKSLCLVKWCPIFDTSPLTQFSKFNNFLQVCWFLGKNLSNFVNPYCYWERPYPVNISLKTFLHTEMIKARSWHGISTLPDGQRIWSWIAYRLKNFHRTYDKHLFLFLWISHWKHMQRFWHNFAFKTRKMRHVLIF